MKAKILPYLCFCIAALGFAWYASSPSKDAESSGREWLSLPKAEIHKITYQDDDGTITAERDGSKLDMWWVNMLGHKKQGDQLTDVTDRFLANDKISELINGLSPYRVEKLIGAADQVNLADFGLDKPSGTFEVSYGEGKSFSLTIGKRSFQSPHVFVLDKQQNKVLLVERKIIAALEKPKARLALIKPFSFDEKLLRSVELSAESKTLLLQRKQKGEQVQWFAASKPEAAQEAFHNWYDKLLKLRIEAYPNAEQLSALSKVEPSLQLRFIGDRGDLDSLSLLQEASEPPRYWLKTAQLPVPVLVDGSRIPVLLKDMTAFLN